MNQRANCGQNDKAVIFYITTALHFITFFCVIFEGACDGVISIDYPECFSVMCY